MKLSLNNKGLGKSPPKYEIVVFVDNHIAGGLATFIELLLPRIMTEKHPTLLILNCEYPGLDQLKNSLPASADVIVYSSLLGRPYFTRVGMPIRGLAAEKLSGLMRRMCELVLLSYECLQIRQKIQLYENQRVLIINGGYPGSYLALAAVLAWSSHCKIFLNCHSLASTPSTVFGVIEKYLDLLIARRTDLLIANSLTTEASLRERLRSETPQSVFVYNAIELPKAEIGRMAYAQPTDALFAEIKIGLVAVLEPRKGHVFALHLLKELRAREFGKMAVLKIIGPDPYGFSDRISQIASELKLSDYVEIIGHLDKSVIYNDLDLVIMPSERAESFGFVAIEALGRGVPVVASAVGALPEILAGFQNATVVSGWILDDWLTAINELVTKHSSVTNRVRANKLTRFYEPDLMALEYRENMGLV